MSKYNIINMETGEVLRSVEEPPAYLNVGEFLVESLAGATTTLEGAILLTNEKTREEIALGYVKDGTTYGLSETDQLNYNSVVSLVNMGAETVTIHGSTETDRYIELSLSNAEAKVFFSEIFSYVESILNKYRLVKKSIYAAENENEIMQILEDNGITNVPEEV